MRLSPSTSNAPNSYVKTSSSFITSLSIKSKIGESFTGSTDKTKSWESEYSPSVTLTEIVKSPYQSSFGSTVKRFPETVNKAFGPSVAPYISSSPSTSYASNSYVKISSSLITAESIKLKIGASLIGLTVNTNVSSVLNPSSLNVTVTKISP